MDWRCNAARAASSSRTSWGTPLMVICTDMNALCHRRQRSASSSPYNRGSDAGGLKAIYEGSSPLLCVSSLLSRRYASDAIQAVTRFWKGSSFMNRTKISSF